MPAGRYVLVGAPGRGLLGPLRAMLAALMLKPFVKPNVAIAAAKPGHADLALIGDLIGAGTIKPMLERRYPLQNTADAIRYVEDGHPGGKVVITVS